MPKICKQTNCNNEAIKVKNHWSGDDYCGKCVTKIDQAADGIREQNNMNISRYGNKEGTIDRDEYWGRNRYV